MIFCELRKVVIIQLSIFNINNYVLDVVDVEGAVLPSLTLEVGTNYVRTLPPNHLVVTSAHKRIKYP